MKCCICKQEIENVNGWKEGHNAEPLASGRCCNGCNESVVIPARIRGVNGY